MHSAGGNDPHPDAAVAGAAASTCSRRHRSARSGSAARLLLESPLSRVVLPDGEPCFEERARHTQLTPDRRRPTIGELVRVPRRSGSQADGGTGCGTATSLLEDDGPRPSRAREAVAGQRSGASQACRSVRRPWPIGRRQLEPLADRAMVDAELPSDRPSGRDVLGAVHGPERCPACAAPGASDSVRTSASCWSAAGGV